MARTPFPNGCVLTGIMGTRKAWPYYYRPLLLRTRLASYNSFIFLNRFERCSNHSWMSRLGGAGVFPSWGVWTSSASKLLSGTHTRLISNAQHILEHTQGSIVMHVFSILFWCVPFVLKGVDHTEPKVDEVNVDTSSSVESFGRWIRALEAWAC